MRKISILIAVFLLVMSGCEKKNTDQKTQNQTEEHHSNHHEDEHY